MEFKDVVQNRYACKKFASKAIEKEKLQHILEASRFAPTAKNLQEQRIYVVSSKEGLEKIDALTPCRYGAPVVLIVAYDSDRVFTYPGNTLDSGNEDATIVATHMMLASKDEGIESCWLNFFDPSKVAEAFLLPKNEKVVMLLDLGYAQDGTGPLPNHFSRKKLDETIKYL